MGKRRLRDRVREAGEAFEKARDAAVEEQLDAARPDDELFFVDTEASQRPAPRTRAEKRRRFFDDRPSSLIMPSVHLVKAVQRVMKTMDTPTPAVAAPATTKAKKGKGKQLDAEAGVYDIWGEEGGAKQAAQAEDDDYVDKQTLEARRRKAPTVARRHPNKAAVPLVAKPLAGQSYHPEAEEHQAALQKALEVEQRREDYIAQLRKPLGGMSEETKALLLSDSDSEEEDEQEGEQEEEQQGERKIAKRKGKLTKAERNKQRRRKQAEHAARVAAEAKAIVKQAARARELAKKLAKEEARKQQEEAVRRKQEGKGKGKETAAPVVVAPKDMPAPDKVVLPADKNPIKARSLPVPLSDELGGSLRLVKAKGSLASEALEGLQRRGEYEAVNDRKRARPKQRVKYMERFRGE